jgi:hypothetical protein
LTNAIPVIANPQGEAIHEKEWIASPQAARNDANDSHHYFGFIFY